jgi:hypothetical protein
MLKEEEIDAWVREKVVSDLIQMKKHMLARAQTGAMNRAIALLIGLKMSHTEEDLKRPFVVPSIRFTPDTSDPEVKRFYLALKAGVVEELYGVQRTPLQPLRAVQDARGDIINELTGQVLDEGFEEDGEQKAIGNGGMKPTGGQGQGPAQPAAQTPTGGSAPPAAGHADDLPLFREEGTSQDTPPPNLFEVKWNEAQTREAKEKVLRELLVKKGKKENELNKGNLKSYSDKGLQSIFDHLFKLTDAA